MGKFTEETCFAINSMGECSALVKTQCENCKFFKNREQVAKERRKAITRLKGLNGGTYYLQKYHPEEVRNNDSNKKSACGTATATSTKNNKSDLIISSATEKIKSCSGKS